MYGVEGAEMAYGAEDVATITTYYDHLERPCEALFQNESGTAILRVFLTRDNAGRLVKEESRCGDQAPFRSHKLSRMRLLRNAQQPRRFLHNRSAWMERCRVRHIAMTIVAARLNVPHR